VAGHCEEGNFGKAARIKRLGPGIDRSEENRRGARTQSKSRRSTGTYETLTKSLSKGKVKGQVFREEHEAKKTPNVDLRKKRPSGLRRASEGRKVAQNTADGERGTRPTRPCSWEEKDLRKVNVGSGKRKITSL